jgi:CRP/FNR family transcriptional regulator, anaerobic regulatory protein
MPTNVSPNSISLISKQFRTIFEPDLIAELEQCAMYDLPAGTELRHEAQSIVKYTPIVLSGKIKVTRVDESGREILLYFIGADESCFLNITAALNNNFGNVMSLRAVLEEPTVMVSVSDRQIRDWNNRYRSWRDYIAKLYHLRFSEFFALVDNIAFRSADEKLIENLKKLQTEQGKILKITHQELAIRMGTAREVVSRLLKTLELDGKIKLGRGEIEIRSL